METLLATCSHVADFQVWLNCSGLDRRSESKPMLYDGVRAEGVSGGYRGLNRVLLIILAQA